MDTLNIINLETILIYCCFFVFSITCCITQQYINKKFNVKKYELKYENERLIFEPESVFSKKGLLADIYGISTTFGSVILFLFLKINELINTFLEGLLVIICYALLIIFTVSIPAETIGKYFYRKFLLKQ